MVYMGSKSKYAKYIVPILQKAIDDNKVDTYNLHKSSRFD